jgi:TP901 family phage tail tape measure protein
MTGVNLGTLFAKLLLEDDFSGTFQKYLSEQDKAHKKSQAVADGFKVMGAALTAVATASVGAAVSMNKNMANIATLVPDNTKRINELKGAVQGMAVELGKGTDDLAGGLYELISSLGDTADNIKILEINAKAASAGLATTQDAINFTTAVTKTYGDTSAAAFQKVSDLGFQAVNLGKTTFPELAQSIGRVAPLAKETGVSMEEMFAVVATATGVTGNTNEVMTQMAAAITAVVSPTAELEDVYQKMGVASGEALIKQRGLTGALQDISKAAKEADVPLINLLGRKEAWIIASSLAGAQADSFSQKMKSMGNVVGATETALRQQTQGIAESSHQWNQWKASVEVAAQKVGDAILSNLPGPLATAAVGFSEMGGQAVASAGSLAQVAIAAKMLGGGNIIGNIGAAANAMTGLTGAASAARLGLIAVGVAIAAWSFAKIYEAIGLLNELRVQSNTLEAEQKTQAQKTADIIDDVRRKTGQTVSSLEDALRVLNQYNRGLTGQAATVTEAATKQFAAWQHGKNAADALGMSTANLARTQKIATEETEKANGTFNPFAESLKKVNDEVRNLSATQRQSIRDGQAMGRNAEEIAKELNKIPGASKVSTEGVQAFMTSAMGAAKATKSATEEIKNLAEQMLGLDAVKDAGNLSKVFGAGDVGFLDPAQIESAITTLQAALSAVERLGVSGAKVTDEQVRGWKDTAKALMAAKNGYEEADREFKGLAEGGIKKIDARLTQATASSDELEKSLKKLKARTADRQFTEGLSEGFREAVYRGREFVDQLEELDYAIEHEANPSLRAMMVEFRNLKADEAADELGKMVYATEEFKAVLIALTPLIPGFAGLVTDVGEASEGSEKKVRKFRGEVESLKGAFTGEAGARFFENLVGNLTASIGNGDSKLQVFQQVGQSIVNQISKGIAANAASSIGGIAGSLAGAGAGMVLGLAFTEAMWHITRGDQERKMAEAADKMRTQIFGQVANGSKQLFEQMLQRAGQTAREIQVIMETGDPEQLSRTWDGAARALQEYNNELKGLERMASGAGMIGQSFGMKMDKSKEAQSKPFEEMQKAAIEAMKAAGAAQSEIDAQLAAFAEQNKNRVYTATEEQITQYNRLGTIVGGTIANLAGRTGDLVGATLANKDAILELLEAQKTFGLEGVTTGATQTVIDLYKTIIENEDVMLSLQGTTQGLTGMSDAMLQNTELANAFGNQLAEDLAELQARGVDTAQAFAMAAPALQRLWELQKEGKVALDETTTAMLAQAEQQGVVGDQMRDVNEQILDVLTQIRDMFSDEIPRAVPRTTEAVRTGATAQQRAAAQTATAWTDSGRDMSEGIRRSYDNMVRDGGTAVDRMKEKLKGLPTQFPIDVEWNIEELILPDPGTLEVPVEFEMGEGRSPWDEQFPGSGGMPPRNPAYDTAGAMAPAGAMEGGRGTQTIILERDGQKDLQFTAENLPDYVRIRAGNTVLGV